MEIREKEIRKRVVNILYTLLVVLVLTFLWWSPYSPMYHKKVIKTSLQSYQAYETTKKALLVRGLTEMNVSKDKQTQIITVKNEEATKNAYTLTFMVENGKFSQDSNQNYYIMYSLKDEDGTLSEPRNLSLDGGLITSALEAGEEKSYTVVLWSEEKNLVGTFSYILNPVL